MIRKNSDSNYQSSSSFSSSDLALAPVVSLHFPIDSIDRTNSRKAKFLFKREEGLDGLVKKYWRRNWKGFIIGGLIALYLFGLISSLEVELITLCLTILFRGNEF